MNQTAAVIKNESWTQYWVWVAVICILAFIVTKDVSLGGGVVTGIALAMGLVLLVKGVSNPDLVTYALVAYLPFSRILPGDFGGAALGLNFTNLLMIFILFVWMNGRYSDGEPLWLPSALNAPIYFFLFLGFIAILRSALQSGDAAHAVIIEFKRWITPIFMYFLVLNTIKDRQHIKKVVIIMCIAVTAVGLMAIYDYMNVGGGSSLEKSRIGGICDQPNMLAAFFNYYMFLPFAFFLMNSNKPKYWLLWIPLAICFRGIMVTFSRGGYIAFAAGFAALLFFRNKMLFAVLLVFCFLAYLNPSLLPAGVRYRMGQTFSAETSYAESLDEAAKTVDKSSSDRVEIWKGGIEMIKDHPFLGVGYGLFQPIVAYYWIGGVPKDAHNTYIILAAEMGIPALLVFLWIVWVVFAHTHRLYRSTTHPFTKALTLGFLGGLFGLLASNMFGSRLDSQEVSSYFWILAAVIFRLEIIEARELGQKKQEKIGGSRSAVSDSPSKDPEGRGKDAKEHRKQGAFRSQYAVEIARRDIAPGQQSTVFQVRRAFS